MFKKIRINKPFKAAGLGLFFILYGITGVAGQDTSDTLHLDLEGAMAIAREHNPTLKVSALEIENAELGINEIRGSYPPSLNISGSYNRNIKRPIIFLPDDSPFGNGFIEVGSDNSFMGTLAAGMPLYNPGLNRSLRAARAEKSLVKEQFRGSKIELEYNVQTAFFDVLLTRESMEVVRKSFLNAKENLERTRKMYEQGTVSEYDLIRAEVQTENLRPNLLEAENAYETTLNYLKALIGMDKTRAVEIKGSLIDITGTMVSDFMVEEAARNLGRNTDLVQMGLQLELIGQQKNVVKAQGLPSLDLAGNYQYQTEANHFRFDDYRWVETFSAGLRLTIPLFNGFAVRTQSRQLQIAGEQIQLQKEFLEDNLKVQLENILNAMKVAFEKTTNARSNVQLAERGFEIAKTRYETGQGTLMELNDSEVALTQARFNLLQAKHEILQAKAEYQKFIGENNKL